MSQINAPFRTFPLLEQLAAFTERRHEVLAGNIANISTPDYKTRDLPVAKFQEALQQAVAGQQRRTQEPRSLTDILGGSSSGNGTSSSPSSVKDNFPAELFQAVERSDNFTFLDGSNRNVEQEVMEMTKNSLIQNFAVELLVAQMGILQAVISERA
ncbi:MAG TPA: hypothetical protein VHB77_02565 [Planctomycetaceae bacterium]|nr:hypothetical protein [Planctomycetaceae bacterium]